MDGPPRYHGPLPNGVAVTRAHRISFDPAKRERTYRERGVDFADAVHVLQRPITELPDVRRDYGEHRIVCYALFGDRPVIVVYTMRGSIKHIISMRQANAREQARYQRLADVLDAGGL